MSNDWSGAMTIALIIVGVILLVALVEWPSPLERRLRARERAGKRRPRR